MSSAGRPTPDSSRAQDTTSPSSSSTPNPPASNMEYIGRIRRDHASNRSAHRFDPLSTSSIPMTDRAFIEFTRCLYQAKSIVKELQTFSDSLCPGLRLSPFNGHSASSSLYDPRLASKEFVQQVYQYVGNTFQKFSRLCKVLLLILDKMEKTPHVRRERIDSFRTEVWEQVRIATDTKELLTSYIQHYVENNKLSPTSPTPNTPITGGSSSSSSRPSKINHNNTAPTSSLSSSSISPNISTSSTTFPSSSSFQPPTSAASSSPGSSSPSTYI